MGIGLSQPGAQATGQGSQQKVVKRRCLQRAGQQWFRRDPKGSVSKLLVAACGFRASPPKANKHLACHERAPSLARGESNGDYSGQSRIDLTPLIPRMIRPAKKQCERRDGKQRPVPFLRHRPGSTGWIMRCGRRYSSRNRRIDPFN